MEGTDAGSDKDAEASVGAEAPSLAAPASSARGGFDGGGNSDRNGDCHDDGVDI